MSKKTGSFADEKKEKVFNTDCTLLMSVEYLTHPREHKPSTGTKKTWK